MLGPLLGHVPPRLGGPEAGGESAARGPRQALSSHGRRGPCTQSGAWTDNPGRGQCSRGTPHRPSLVLARSLSGSFPWFLSNDFGFVWSLDHSLPPTHPAQMPGRPSTLSEILRRADPPSPSTQGGLAPGSRVHGEPEMTGMWSVAESQTAATGPQSRTQGPFGEGSRLAAVLGPPLCAPGLPRLLRLQLEAPDQTPRQR